LRPLAPGGGSVMLGREEGRTMTEEVILQCTACGTSISDPMLDRCPGCGVEIRKVVYREVLPTLLKAGAIALVIVLALFWGSQLLLSLPEHEEIRIGPLWNGSRITVLYPARSDTAMTEEDAAMRQNRFEWDCGKFKFAVQGTRLEVNRRDYGTLKPKDELVIDGRHDRSR
jgi:hypothetical protein